MTAWLDGVGIVTFPDRRRIRGRGLRKTPPAGAEPDFGVYLLPRDPGPCNWEHRWVQWRDFRTPSSSAAALEALDEAYRRSVDERVEIACAGGVGRTGTALAAIAVFAGIPPDEAVAWVRRHYHARAVEMPWQQRWVRKAATPRGTGG